MNSLLGLQTAHVPVLYEISNHGTAGYESLDIHIQAFVQGEAHQDPTTVLITENIRQGNTVTQGTGVTRDEGHAPSKGPTVGLCLRA